MIWIKIIFIIWVCTLSSTQGNIADIFANIFFKNIKAFFKPEDTAVGLKNVEIDEEHVDLTSLPHDDFKFCKNMVLLYCDIIDTRFLDRQRPLHWHSLRELENLEENYNGPVPSDEELHDEPLLIHKTAAFKRLSDITFDLIEKYDALIQPKGYIDMAFYYNVLTWLHSNMPLSKKLLDQIIHIKNIKIKARNYFQEFTPFDKLYTERKTYVHPGINLADDKYKKIEGWQEDDKHSIALAFIQDMIASKGEAAKSIPMKIRDIDVYEEILADADQEMFYHAMRIEKWTALRIVDKSFHVIYKEQLSTGPSNQVTVHTLFTELNTDFDLINLSNNPPGSLPYCKYSAILFKEALERKIGRFLLVNQQQYLDLYQYPERYQPNETLRYCTFQWWFSNVIQQMKFALSITTQKDKFLMRVYIYRMVSWLMFQLHKENKNIGSCVDLNENLGALLTDLRIATHPFVVLMHPDKMRDLFQSENETATNLEKLSTLGEHHHLVLSSMLHILQSQMEKDLDNYGQLKKALEEQKKNRDVATRTTHPSQNEVAAGKDEHAQPHQSEQPHKTTTAADQQKEPAQQAANVDQHVPKSHQTDASVDQNQQPGTTAKAAQPASDPLQQRPDTTTNPDQHATQQPEQHDDTTADEITVEDCDESIKTINWGLHKLYTWFGEIEPRVHFDNFDEYNDLMDMMDQENIPLIFFMNRERLSDLIKTALKENSSLHEVHIAEADHEGPPYEEHVRTGGFVARN